MNDSELARKLKKKEEKAFETVIRQYTPLVATIVRNVSKGLLSKEDIEETVTDVFVTLWKNTDSIIEDKLKGYLCRIARTRTLNRLSAVRNHEVLNIDDYDLEDDFSLSAEVEKNAAAAQLREIISEIEMPDREIIIRYYYYAQNTTKISEVMGLNLHTVKSKLQRTRSKIKSKLLERGYV